MACHSIKPRSAVDLTRQEAFRSDDCGRVVRDRRSSVVHARLTGGMHSHRFTERARIARRDEIGTARCEIERIVERRGRPDGPLPRAAP